MIFLSTPPDQALNARRIANWISPRLRAGPARREPSPLPFGLRKVASRDRGELLVLLAFLFCFLVLGREKPAVAGEELGPGHGVRRGARWSAGAPSGWI